MKKILFPGLIGIIALFILVSCSVDFGDYFTKNSTRIVAPIFRSVNANETSCYNETSDNNGFQEFDLTEEKEELKLGRNIFFHETSCFREEGLLLNSRQACAVESAARMNPNMTIYLLVLSPFKISKFFEPLLQQLLSYENIKIRRIYINDYVRHTPLEEWYASGILRTSRWPRSHMSDILRYLTLWKFGGIYLDLDVVVTKSLEDLDNFTGAEDEDDVAAGVIGFGMGNLGRNVSKACLQDLKKNFRGNVWGNNGPGVITRVLQKMCATKYVRKMTSSRCSGFEVFPPSTFYPIHYKKWTKYFDLDAKNETMKLIENSKAVHVWNKLSKKKKIQVGSQVPYAIIAQNYCPKVYNNCGSIF